VSQDAPGASPTGIDAAGFRQIMGHFATGVTVVTSALDGRLHGMTANAVTSVSINPVLLLVCVEKNAHMHQEIETSGRFGVNILSQSQEHASRLFATKMEPEEGRMGGLDFHLGPNGLPVLEGAIAFLECEVKERCEGGDHSIFIGAVIHGEVLDETSPLLFFRGGYHGIQAS
jgi:flavin reductase (DIM6/NTAB) family NADH-FMN oxidoreductase RutF